MREHAAFDLHPALAGATITLRPLRADDLEALHAAADPLIWAKDEGLRIGTVRRPPRGASSPVTKYPQNVR